MTEEEFDLFCRKHSYDEEDAACARRILRERPDVADRPDWIHTAVGEMVNSKYWQVELSVNDALEYTKALKVFEDGYIEKWFGITDENREQKELELLAGLADWLAKDLDEIEEEPEPFAEKGRGFDAYAVALNALGDQIAGEEHCIVIGKATMEPGMDIVALRVAVTSPEISDRARRLLMYAENLCDRVGEIKMYGNPLLEFELEITKARI